MIPVNITVNDFLIKNLCKDDLEEVLYCINESKENLNILGIEDILTIENLKERYIETLINSFEYFCGIYIEDKVIGIIKGRIENKNTKDLWILSFLLMEEYRGIGIGTKVLHGIEEYFMKNFGIKNCCVMITGFNHRSKSFWKQNRYSIIRITKNNDNQSRMDIIILKKG